MEIVNSRWGENKLNCLLSLVYLTLTGTGGCRVDDGICGKRGKVVCDGTDGELVNDLLHFDNSDRVVFIHLNDAAKS